MLLLSRNVPRKTQKERFRIQLNSYKRYWNNCKKSEYKKKKRFKVYQPILLNVQRVFFWIDQVRNEKSKYVTRPHGIQVMGHISTPLVQLTAFLFVPFRVFASSFYSCSISDSFLFYFLLLCSVKSFALKNKGKKKECGKNDDRSLYTCYLVEDIIVNGIITLMISLYNSAL